MSKLYGIEQQIMNCWSVVDDIKDLREIQDTRVITPDELDNYLLGLQTIYQVKFEKLFSLYEKALREKANLP